MPHDPYKALYIHLPFCKHRCAYCDFTTRAIAPDSVEIDEYIDNLILELRRKANEGELAEIETVYLGGGTPSFVGQARLSKLLYALGVFMNLTPEVECSMEANPDSLTPELIRDFHWRAKLRRRFAENARSHSRFGARQASGARCA